MWLFHGTDETTVPKITSMGFNRSFCGKNATMFGKGVYFARDASYSSSTTYSRPNAKGIQHMFLCRVVVGVYCQGQRDALTPDVRQGHTLYDTTVNDVKAAYRGAGTGPARTAGGIERNRDARRAVGMRSVREKF